MAAQALIVDLSPTKERAILLGRLTFSYSIGSAIGPALGGLIVSTSITVGARSSVGMLRLLVDTRTVKCVRRFCVTQLLLAQSSV
jgi:MFS family permease